MTASMGLSFSLSFFFFSVFPLFLVHAYRHGAEDTSTFFLFWDYLVATWLIQAISFYNVKEHQTELDLRLNDTRGSSGKMDHGLAQGFVRSYLALLA